MEVDALRVELSENKHQLARLQERYAETEKEQRESESAISTAKRLLHVKESSTLSEIMRLKGTYSPFHSGSSWLIRF